VVTFLLPLHVLIAVAAEPLVVTFLPRRWLPAIPLLVLLSLAGGFRCCDIAATTALKAGGRSGLVLALALLRIGAIVAALLVSMPHGIVVATLAVLGVRVLIALVATLLALTQLPMPAEGRLPDLGVIPFALWTALFLACTGPLDEALGTEPLALLLALGLTAVPLWFATRWIVDRPALSREWSWFQARLASRGDPM
jgi:O-antigen/teichoic acid export membrane protein